MTTLHERIDRVLADFDALKYYDADARLEAEQNQVIREQQELLRKARDALGAGELCAQVIALGGGAAGNEVAENELPLIRKALAKLNAALGEK